MKRKRMSRRASRREFRANVGKVDRATVKLVRGGPRN